jgi:DNA-binding transcriptional regulator YiaG
MPNFASALKQEVLRLARKELRKELEGLKKASAQYRSDIAGLKRQVASLERQMASIGKKHSKEDHRLESSEIAANTRFSAKGFATRRQRLGLSAAEMGLLLGVSAQTVYHWETGKTRPRASQLGLIVALRGMGKRAIKSRLETSTR